jgi:multiple sugar transport system permease protein
MNSRNGKMLGTILYHTLVALLGFIMIYPILWLVASSFKDNSEVFVRAYSLIPERFAFENYSIGWKGFGGTSFAVFFKNSFIITVLGTIGEVFSSIIVAYGFSRIKFTFKKFWFLIMMLTMMLPSQVLIIPQYILFSKLGWINSFKPLIVPAFFGSAFFIFLAMQFIQGIPKELDESAKMDGCGKFAIFLRIILPLLKPVIVTIAIFSFYWRWEDFFGPLLYLNKPQMYPATLALKLFSDPTTKTSWGAMFAMSVVSELPVFIIFLLFQKYIVEGISTSGLKG